MGGGNTSTSSCISRKLDWKSKVAGTQIRNMALSFYVWLYRTQTFERAWGRVCKNSLCYFGVFVLVSLKVVFHSEVNNGNNKSNSDSAETLRLMGVL